MERHTFPEGEGPTVLTGISDFCHQGKRNVRVTQSLRSIGAKLFIVFALVIKFRPRREDMLAFCAGAHEGPTLDATGHHAVPLLIS